jgi:hypothetical protein
MWKRAWARLLFCTGGVLGFQAKVPFQVVWASPPWGRRERGQFPPPPLSFSSPRSIMLNATNYSWLSGSEWACIIIKENAANTGNQNEVLLLL